jgi:hypothetical protein
LTTSLEESRKFSIAVAGGIELLHQFAKSRRCRHAGESFDQRVEPSANNDCRTLHLLIAFVRNGIELGKLIAADAIETLLPLLRDGTKALGSMLMRHIIAIVETGGIDLFVKIL